MVTALLAGGCASGGQALQRADAAMKAGNLDQAVAMYRALAQSDPDNGDYQIALQRAMQAASRMHLDQAKTAEAEGQLEAARSEYTRASEYDPSNRFAADKARDIDRTLRERADAARPRPFQDMQARARAGSPVPILNPGSREPITLVMTAPIRDILNGIGMASGIDILFDRDAEGQALNRQTSVDLQGLTLEQALNYLMSANQLSYKVISPRTILVFQDVANKHLQYDDQVIQTFPIAHADPAQLVGVIMAIVRIQGLGVQPLVQANPSNGTIVAKATVPIMEIIAKIIEQNDKPPAEVIIDVEILEVNRTRAKQYGLDLGNYSLPVQYSPNGAPSVPAAPVSLETFRNGIAASDFYLGVPTAVVRALASDQHTKLLAKPQLRGAEGQKMSLRLGQQIPTPSTTFTPIATGGASTNPLTTFQYKDVGVILDITPRVTLDNDIILDLLLDNSARGPDVVVNEVTAPSFTTRSVAARLRLRDGESNLIAGLLQEDDRKSVTGFPGAINVPVLKQLFSSNDNARTTTDIVMLLTPRIIRGKEFKEQDLRPVYIGSGQSFGLNGPPPLIAVQVPPAVPAAAAPAGAAGSGGPVAGGAGASQPSPKPGAGATIVAPPGSSPVPGTIAVPVPAPTPGATPAQPVTPAPSPVPVQSAPPPGADATPAAAPQQPSAPPPPTASSTGPGQAAPAPTGAGGAVAAQVTLTTPGSPVRVGGGPYTVPITVNNASRLSTVTMSVTFDPTKLRVRTVQEGSFMRSGGAAATFTQQAGSGRVDITIVRPGDTTGASGGGTLGAILFDAIGAGTAALNASGLATGPGGGVGTLSFGSASVTIEQ
jgi:general secretion pathway protein D